MSGMKDWYRDLLRPVGTITISAFEGCQVHVEENFIERADNARSVEFFESLECSYSDLQADVKNYDIHQSLARWGQKYFQATEVAGVIERLVLLQPNGEDGALKNDGSVNIFYYASGSVLTVSWDKDANVWYIDAVPSYACNERWSGNERVFSRKAVPKA